ncbi:phosphatidylserine decarboxylase family protein [Desulfonatronum thiodismutans]|uniref:phosphatidylserine decarboxylase family protein n=1 Tax=Desulfonatronum thiodismutans TaxID=159290 RepID=UPI0004ABD459|nr:phosphatidylserine decarboxylase family protein [Desulfonatronum thiodismutans]
MRQSSPGVAKEGLPYIGLGAFVTLILAVLGWGGVAVIALVLTILTLNFFRDPERVTPQEPGLAVAPADGKIVFIGPAVDPATGQVRTKVSIFMNVFNVHVNRTPVTGRVGGITYFPGKFLNAALDKASEDNERNQFRIVDEHGHGWTVVQIAGLVARRIVCWAEEGDEVARGQRIGLIKFGSRVDLYLPDAYEVRVTKGQHTCAGLTVMAALKDQHS